MNVLLDPGLAMHDPGRANAGRLFKQVAGHMPFMPPMRVADTFCRTEALDFCRTEALDVVAERRTALVRRRPASLRDRLHGTWLGLPLPPVVERFTIGCMTSGALPDLPAAGVLQALAVASLPAAEGRGNGNRTVGS